METATTPTSTTTTTPHKRCGAPNWIQDELIERQALRFNHHSYNKWFKLKDYAAATAGTARLLFLPPSLPLPPPQTPYGTKRKA